VIADVRLSIQKILSEQIGNANPHSWQAGALKCVIGADDARFLIAAMFGTAIDLKSI